MVIAAAIAVGLVTGLLGAGGGVISVPAFMYGASMSGRDAVAHSLVVVAIINTISALRERAAGRLRIRSALPFAFAGMAGSFTAAQLARFMSEPVQMALFSILLFVSGGIMIKKGISDGGPDEGGDGEKASHLIAMPTGFAVGAMSGLLGIGGGVFMVPVFATWLGYNMVRAVAAAQCVIAFNTTSGAIGYIGRVHFNFWIIFLFVCFGVMGSLFGTRLRLKLPQKQLKLIFGVLVVAMGVFILYDRVLN